MHSDFSFLLLRLVRVDNLGLSQLTSTHLGHKIMQKTFIVLASPWTSSGNALD